jgi:hypothetical protein
MDMVTALAISVAVLLAVLVKAGSIFSLNVPIAIIAWACFFATGGKLAGLTRTLASMISGVIWMLLGTMLTVQANLWSYGWAIVGVIGFIVVIQSKLKILSFIPGALLGVAVTRASGAGTVPFAALVVVAVIVGAVAGYVSELVAGAMAKKSHA